MEASDKPDFSPRRGLRNRARGFTVGQLDIWSFVKDNKLPTPGALYRVTGTGFQIGVFANRWVVLGIAAMILLQLLFTYVPLMNSALSSAPISAASWGRIVGVGLAGYLIVEAEKWLRRRRMPAPSP